MMSAVLPAKITRFSVPFSFLAAQGLLWLVWQHNASPIQRGFANGEIDGPGGIGAMALLFGLHSFLAAGSICVLALSIRLWIEGR